MSWLNRLPNKHETCGFLCDGFLLERSPGSIRRPSSFFLGGLGTSQTVVYFHWLYCGVSVYLPSHQLQCLYLISVIIVCSSLSDCLINFVSWNVKSLNHPVKRKKVLTHLHQLKADIAFLQETHLCISDHSRLRSGWIGQIYHSKFNCKSRGAAILINKSLPFVATNIDADPGGRFIIVVGKVYGSPWCWQTFMPPTGMTPVFLVMFFQGFQIWHHITSLLVGT